MSDQEARNDENSDLISTKNEINLVGLKNQGATCYMNSLLQALFNLPAFRRIVYKMPTTGNENIEENIPLNLQRLFAMMQFSSLPCSTKALTKSFGWKDDETFMQHDLQEFSRVLIDNLETKLKGDTELKDSISNIFKGQFVSFIRCKKVDYESSKNEEFYDLTLQVKGCSNLNESFEKYIEKEQLVGDNQYQAGSHGLQDAEMGVEFTKFPSVLHLHLGRFEYNAQLDQMTKINDRFEFPESIDLAPFLSPNADHNQSLIYDLYGVLVHLGDVFSGHYYAYLRTSTDPQWYKFDDTFVTKVSSKEAIEDNYGETASSSRNDIYRQHMMYSNRYGMSNYGYPNTSYGLNQSFGKKYSAYMLVYIRREDANRIMAPVTLSEIPKHIQLYAEKQIQIVKLRSEIKNDVNNNNFLVILKEEDLKNNTLMGIDSYIPPFVNDYNLSIFDQHKIHPNNMIVLKDKELDPNNYRYDLLESMRFKIPKRKTTADLYEMISERFNIPLKEIRMWYQEDLQNRLKIVNCRDQYISSQTVPSSLLYYQHKEVDDVVSMTNDERLIFVKYFFPTASLPIQFVHSYVVKTVQTFTDFCNQVNEELGIELGEDDKMLIYRQYNDKKTGEPNRVDIIPSKFKMKDVPSGVFIFLQIDPTVNIDQYYNFEYQKDLTFDPSESDYDQKLRDKYENADETLQQSIDEIREKMKEKRDRVYSIRPSKVPLQEPIPVQSFIINEDKGNESLPEKEQIKIFKESEIFPRIAMIYPYYILEKYSKIEIDIYRYEQKDKPIFKVEVFSFSTIKRLKQIIAHGINENYNPDENAIILYTVKDNNPYYEEDDNNTDDDNDENDDKIELSVCKLYQSRNPKVSELFNDSKNRSNKKNYRLYFTMMNNVDESQAMYYRQYDVQISLDGVNVQQEKILQKYNIKVKDLFNVIKGMMPQISEMENKYLSTVPIENKNKPDESSSDDSSSDDIIIAKENDSNQIFRFFEIKNHKYYRQLKLSSVLDYNIDNIRIEFIPEEQRELKKDEYLIQVVYLHIYEYYKRSFEYVGNPFFIVVKKGETFAEVKQNILDKVTDKNNILNFYIRALENGRYIRQEAKDDMIVSNYCNIKEFCIYVNLKNKQSDASLSIKIYN